MNTQKEMKTKPLMSKRKLIIIATCATIILVIPLAFGLLRPSSVYAASFSITTVVRSGVKSMTAISSSPPAEDYTLSITVNNAKNDTIVFSSDSAINGKYDNGEVALMAGNYYVFDINKDLDLSISDNMSTSNWAYTVGYNSGSPIESFRRHIAVYTVNGGDYENATELSAAIAKSIQCDISVSIYSCTYTFNKSQETIVRHGGRVKIYNLRITKASVTVTEYKNVVNDIYYAQSAFTATVSAESATYTHNGISKGSFASGSRLTASGRYEITAQRGDCVDTKIIIIDRAAPEIIITDIYNAGISAYVTDKTTRATFSADNNEAPIVANILYAGASGTSTYAYESGSALVKDGKYMITATDFAGNTSIVTLYIDTAAPVLSSSAEYAKDGASAIFSYREYETPVTAVYTFNSATDSKKNVANVDYNSNIVLTEEGKYTITAVDIAGNKANVVFWVDRTAPTLTFGSGESADVVYNRSGNSVKYTYDATQAPITAVYTFNSSVDDTNKINVTYSSNFTLSAEGKYTITATDKAGNAKTVTLYIDRTAPMLTFSTISGVEFERWTNTEFIARTQEPEYASGVVKFELYVTNDNGSKKYVDYDYSPLSENGEYLFRATDRAGNITAATATHYYTETYGNSALIYNSYKLNSYYVVTLPPRIFATIAGSYSFSTYTEAWNFAVGKEMEYRVSTVQGGYMYVTATNETIPQKYTDKAMLDVVVGQYAQKYVSSRIFANEKGNNRYYNEPYSMTRNTPELPDCLAEYSALPRMLAQGKYTWSLPKLSYISQLSYQITATYLGDYTSDKGDAVTYVAGTTLVDAYADVGYAQGWYHIVESDGAGNCEEYLIYSDAELPKLQALATFGNADELITFTPEYVKDNTCYFVTLQLDALLDNIDDYITLKIGSGASVTYFTQDDALPTLGTGDYLGGRYTITVYDRSLNVLSFDVFIAATPIAMSHSSLAADRDNCTVSFTSTDKFCVLVAIELYRIEYDGKRVSLTVDDAGTQISAKTTSYTFFSGGKYGATITDNYRRTIELDPIFFLKGLPSATFSGVTNGGITNKNVSIAFPSTATCDLYTILPNGERVGFNDYTTTHSSSNTTFNILASESTTAEYYVFLYLTSDKSLFVEYTFNIDCILPDFVISDIDGNVIDINGATNKPFSIAWSETDVRVKYTTANSLSMSQLRYTMSSRLTAATLYYFTLIDMVGNSIEFTVLLDNTVNYTLSGDYNDYGGKLYTNMPITLTVNEPTRTFIVENEDGYTIDNGGTLTQSGEYTFTITDNYGNTVTLYILIDFTAPIIELVGASPGTSVKSDVTVNASGYDRLYLADKIGNKIKDLNSGVIFSAPGSYYVIASDYAGNTVTVTFSIDMQVDYALSVPSGAIVSGKVLLTTKEELNIAVIKDGEQVDSITSFNDVGYYELALTDSVGNTATACFCIVPSAARSLELYLPQGTTIRNITLNDTSVATTTILTDSGQYVITLDCSGVEYEFAVTIDSIPPQVDIVRDKKGVSVSNATKENCKYELTCDGVAVDFLLGKTFTDPGHYVLTIIDNLGNVAVYEFDVKFRLNTWAVVVIGVGVAFLVVIFVIIIRARRRPRLK